MSAGSEVVYARIRDGREFIELSADHLAAVNEFTKAFLVSAGVVEGDIILLIGDGNDTSLLSPFARAAAGLHCTHCAADTVRFVRANLLAFFEQFRYRLVLGLTAEIVDVVQEQGVDLKTLFAGAQIYATPEAKAVMHDAEGVKTWLPMGPFVAVESADGDLRVPIGALRVTSDPDGTVFAHPIEGAALPLAVSGTISDSPCPFGLSSRRFVLEAALSDARCR